MIYTAKAQIEALKALDKGERVWYGKIDGGYMLSRDNCSFVCIPEGAWYLDETRLECKQGLVDAQTRNVVDAHPAEPTAVFQQQPGKERLRVFKTQEGEKLLNEKYLTLAPVVSWCFYQSCLYGLDCEGRLVCGAMITDPRRGGKA